ncbi:MAG: O-acetyl-ADP-ribose deacetylase [Oscillospiraceae bacterium]|nr:O-acetyl-ADP-ribose deacetylase [Oscillospiraceae bacterium]
MPFQIIRADLTKLRVDAVVNAANSSLLGGGGVDGAIHRAAGPELREYCAGLGGCRTGEAKLSPGFGLPAKWIIHTVGPIWQGGVRNEESLLRACYRSSLALALEQGCESVAFPLISAGVYGYPKDEAFHVAVREIADFLREHEMTVILTVFDDAALRASSRRFPRLRSLLEPRLPSLSGAAFPRPSAEDRPACSAAPLPAGLAAPAAPPPKKQKKALFPRPRRKKERAAQDTEAAREEAAPSLTGAGIPGAAFYGNAAPRPAETPAELDARLRCLDESFSQMLLRKIDEKGLTDAACYKRANVDRKLFSKIRSDLNYRPSKPTAIAFAIALELPLEETRELLMKAGFALSPSSKFDVIIEYFIGSGNYDIFEINEALFTFDQNLLGA